VPAALPVKTLKDLIAHVKANPKSTSFGSYGNGTSAHIQGTLLNMQAGLDMTHVPYKGSAPLITDLIGGQVTAAFVDAASLAPHIAGGKIRLLGVTGTARNKIAADVPTMLEMGYKDYEPYGWFGLFMPAGTPADIVNKFSTEAARILRSAEGAGRIESLGLAPVGNTPAQFAKTVRDDAALYERIIRAADIRID
jgi:tripartite-type tricarboxylate transporter receptor subunit TctC